MSRLDPTIGEAWGNAWFPRIVDCIRIACDAIGLFPRLCLIPSYGAISVMIDAEDSVVGLSTSRKNLAAMFGLTNYRVYYGGWQLGYGIPSSDLRLVNPILPSEPSTGVQR